MVLILLVGFLLRIWYLGNASLWSDEVLTAIRAQAPFDEAINSLLRAGNQTPFYFMSLRLIPNYSEELLRLPSVLMGLIGIALVVFVGYKLYHNYDIALWAGAVLAVNPYHIWLSRTARPYAMLFMFSILASYFFLMLVRDQSSRKMWICFSAASLLAYFTHYTTIALPAAQFFFLVIYRKRTEPRFFKRWVGAQAAACVPVIIWLYIVSQHNVGIGPGRFPNPTLRDLPLTLWSMTTGFSGDVAWWIVPGLVVVALSLIFGVYYAVRERNVNQDNVYWALLVFVPLIPTFLLSAFAVSIYLDRYFMVFLPALIFLITMGWKRHSKEVMQIAMAVIILTGANEVMFELSTGSFQRDNWRSATEYVAENYEPGDGILFQWWFVQKAFLYYFEQDDRVDLDMLVLYETPDTTQFEASNRRVWAIYRNPHENVHRQGVMPNYDPFKPGRTDLGDWLYSRQDQIVEWRKFNGMTIVLLDMRGKAIAQR